MHLNIIVLLSGISYCIPFVQILIDERSTTTTIIFPLACLKRKSQLFAFSLRAPHSCSLTSSSVSLSQWWVWSTQVVSFSSLVTITICRCRRKNLRFMHMHTRYSVSTTKHFFYVSREEIIGFVRGTTQTVEKEREKKKGN